MTPVMCTCRAKALAEEAGKAGDAHSVPAGTYVEVHVADVPTSAAAAVVQRVSTTLKVCPADAICLGLSCVDRTQAYHSPPACQVLALLYKFCPLWQ